MSKNNGSSGSSGIGISGVLTIVFIVLKLVGVINWSWWWVLCPICINVLLVGIIFGIIIVCGKISDRKYNKTRKIK